MTNKSILQLFITLLLVLVSTLAHRSSAASLEPLTVDMGSQETLHSKTFNQQRSLYVRLPKNYELGKKSYPVLYLLDANSFFAGNIYHEAVSLVSRLERVQDIPEMIVVGIQSDQWYKDVITESKPFEQFVSREVVDFIEHKYRTSENKILMGHSYAGAFVSGAMPIEQKSFDLFLTLSPVYPSMSFLEQVKKRYQNLKPLSAKLTIIDGDESPMDKQILKQAASQLSGNTLSFDYLSMKLDGHMSVLTIGLSHGLREHFSDFRFPSRKLVRENQFDIQKLKSYFKKKDEKYGTTTDDTFIKSAAISMAHRYTSMQKLEQALPFWRFGHSKFKEYFMGGYAERFVALGKVQLANQIWKEMAKLFPDSDKNYSEMILRKR